MSDTRDIRTLRLLDLDRHDTIQVWCPGCGWTVSYGYGGLQRLERLSSTTLVFDLQFLLRCGQCRCREGFRIAIVDERSRGDRSKDPNERVVVEGAEPRYKQPIQH